jgi:rhodanese-related sulfurtransferase
LCEDARSQVRELTIDDVKEKLARKEKFHLIDVREESEWAAGRLPTAEYMGRGIIERDIEKTIPDPNAELVLYCGGGFRSALAAVNLQKMGYTNVYSMDGGVRGWKEAGLEIVK